MHSDESWLSGLTRTMMQNGLDSTEPFFDLLPRYPHAIKTVFHILQMPFILALGYNLFAVRLLSLLFGVFTLYFVYALAGHLTGSQAKGLLAAALLSMDAQFIYSSHFARQDIIIAFGIVAVLYYIVRNIETWSFRQDIVTGIITGLFIGVHPNSLMLAFGAGALYLYYILIEKKLALKNLIALIITVACFAGLFIGISYMFDGEFISHYMKFGSELGVKLSISEKLNAFPLYYYKLWNKITGTYYIPELKLPLAVFGISLIASVLYFLRDRQILRLLFPILVINIGFIVIGRYSQPSLILLFPIGYLLVVSLIDRLSPKWKQMMIGLLCGATILNSVFAIKPYLNDDYEDYLYEIGAVVQSESIVLANLNAEYAFDNYCLLDYRNLEHLDTVGLSFEEYVAQRGIEYIIYPEEMDFIFENRPVWNIMYGNPYPYFSDMKRFLEESCTRIKVFSSPYAMRITPYMYAQNWEVRIYRVDKEQP